MKIYPKTNSKLQGFDGLKKCIAEYKGIEIQMLEWDDIDYIDEVLKNLINEIPDIEEVTIHPPIKDGEFNIEVLTHRKYDVEVKRIQKLVNISSEYNIKVNMLYHTRWNYVMWKDGGLIDELENLLKYLQNTNVIILLENWYSMNDKENCAIMQVVKEIDNKHLKLCIDTCHLKCQANIFNMEFNSFLNNYLKKEDCEKYVYQIHFAATLDNDGYINKKTHGRRHINVEDLKNEYEILEKLGIEDKIIVTEISEDDYTTRVDQIEEINMLESIVPKGTVLFGTAE